MPPESTADELLELLAAIGDTLAIEPSEATGEEDGRLPPSAGGA
jgi:hypothetical protein